MKNKREASKTIAAGILVLFIFANFLPHTEGTYQQTYTEKNTHETIGKNITIVSHPATREDIETMKQRYGVNDPTKNNTKPKENNDTNGVPPTENEWNTMVDSLEVADEIIVDREVPSFVDLSDSDYFPQVGDQGDSFSCTAWAAAYYATGYIQAINNGWTQAHTGNPDQILSPAFNYNLCEGYPPGSQTYYILESLKTIGCCTWNQMPFDEHEENNWGNENAWRDAPQYRISEYYYLEDKDQIKAMVSTGFPVVFVLNSWTYHNLAVFGSDDVLGSDVMIPGCTHAQTIVGYDDMKRDWETHETGAFKIVNSKGNWGPRHNGYYWITYEAFVNFCMSSPVLVPFEPTYMNDDFPRLLGTWEFSTSGDTDVSILLGIGPYEDPLETRIPFYIGDDRYSFPPFMCLDITEFYDQWLYHENSFFLEVSGYTHETSVLSSFKIEYYRCGYTPGDPYSISTESPDIPLETPCHVHVDFSTPALLTYDSESPHVLSIPWG